jgi:hypothetical protein
MVRDLTAVMDTMLAIVATADPAVVTAVVERV